MGKKLSYPIFFEAICLELSPCMLFRRPVTPSDSSEIVNMISSLQGSDIFTEFKQELQKYNKGRANPRQIQVVGWFEGTGIARSGSTLFGTAANAKYSKAGSEKYSAVLKTKTDGVNTLDLLNFNVHNKLKEIVSDFLKKHQDVVSSIIFDDRYGIFKDAMPEIAARYNIPNGYPDGQTGWIRDRLTKNLQDIKNTVATFGKKFSISSHNFSWAAEKNNQDLARWLQQGIIDGEYNFQLYKNGSQYPSFVDEYDRNMREASTVLSKNKTGVIPSLSVSLGYTAGRKDDKPILLSKADIEKQVNYIITRIPKKGEDFPVLNSENILGFDYGNLVTKVPPDQTPKLA